MKEISLYSFLAVVVFQYIGAYAHFRKLKYSKRVRGSYFNYLFADSRNKSAATGVLMLGSAWFSCTAGTADLINPQLVWAFLEAGVLHVPSISAALTAIAFGFAFDSGANKGEV